MKRTLSTLSILFAALLTLLPLSALADVVFTTFNSFYEQYKDECVPVNQTFCFPDEPMLKREPGSDINVNAPMGLFRDYGYYVHRAYNRAGELWGYMSGFSHGYSYAGWIPLDGAMLAYNPELFREEYGAAFYAFSESDEEILTRLDDAAVIVYWRWPCSGKQVHGSGGLSMDVSTPEAIRYAGGDYRFTDVFKDEQGREWSYFVCNWKSGWICLDDPENAAIPATIDHPAPWEWNMEDYPPGSAGRPGRPGKPMDERLVWTIILVAAAVLGSAGLVFFLLKPKKRVNS